MMQMKTTAGKDPADLAKDKKVFLEREFINQGIYHKGQKSVKMKSGLIFLLTT